MAIHPAFAEIFPGEGIYNNSLFAAMILFHEFFKWQVKSGKERRGDRVFDRELFSQVKAFLCAPVNFGRGAFRINDPVFLNCEARVKFKFGRLIDFRCAL